MNLIQDTKFILNKYKISANKKLGQNFLIDENTIEQIVEKADVGKNDLIIEIGPGLGNLTSKLLDKAGKVIAIELDTKMLTILNDRFKFYDNIELINQDILKVDLNSLIKENLNEDLKTCKIVANLPYYITTPIIVKLLEERLNIYSITVMVQKEVAERLTSVPGIDKNIGAITYDIYYYCDSEIVLNVPRSFFLPEPDVDSSVISLKLLKEPRVKPKDEQKMFNLIKLSFSQKRKTLQNSLVNNGFCSSKVESEQILKDSGINPNARPETLSLEEFEKISEKI